MKNMKKKRTGVVKGAPSGFVISLMVHAAAFMLAGLLVVFSVVQKEEKKFVPPKPVDRPKMKLKKPKVKVKKSAKPKATTRIVTKVKRASMPDIQLPEMSGMADGLAGGIGGFDIMPDLGEITVFGGGQSLGNDFVGTFYDFKRDRRGRTVIMDPDKFTDELTGFVKRGWKTSKIARYYRSPKKLYATSFMIPQMLSSVAPAAFDEADTLGYCWMAHYKGQLVHKEGITFRFWGQGDDILFVRVNGKVVLSTRPDMHEWQTTSPETGRYFLGHWQSYVGDWITLEPGVPLDMEVMFAEVPGGWFYAMLVVEEKGVDYPSNRQGGPILPMFKTAEPSLDLEEAIHGDLVEGEAAITGGPVFNDFYKKAETNAVVAVVPASAPQPEVVEEKTRLWTTNKGKSFEAEYISLVGGNVVLKNPKGKQVKFALAELSEEDQLFIELVDPPEFSIDFAKKSSQQILGMSPFNSSPPPKLLDYVFSVKLKQDTSAVYNHELTVEFFAIGAEIDGDNFILLDRQESSFIPSEENKRSHAFSGDTITLTDFDHINGLRRGQRYSSYLIVVTDSRGEIIQYETPKKWLFEHLENLKKVPVGKHIDETCTRVLPISPPSRDY